MKYLAALFLVLYMSVSNASQCSIDGLRWQRMPKNNVMHISVPVQKVPGSQRILLNGYTLQCAYEPDETLPLSAKDFWHTAANAITPGPKFTQYSVGLNINGSDYNAPVGAGIHIATMSNFRPGHGIPGVDLRTFMFISTRGSPGNPVNIRTGDNLGVLHLSQTNNTGKPPVPHVYIYINAANDLIVEPSTCTINNNQPIEINFDQVNQALIGDSPGSTPISVTKRLNYKCPTPGITMPIKITLKGQATTFNSNILRLSNLNLGTGLLRNGVLIGPEKSFNTNIYNSTGADDVVFALVRKPGTLPATGAFTGSGTLVMGVP